MPSDLPPNDINPHLTTSTALLPLWALASLTQPGDNFNVLPEKPKGRKGKGRKERAVLFQLPALSGCTNRGKECYTSCLDVFALPKQTIEQQQKTPFISYTHFNFFLFLSIFLFFSHWPLWIK